MECADFPPAIPAAGSMPPPPALEASIEKPKERRRRDRSRSRRDKDPSRDARELRGARRRRGDPPSSEGRSGGRSGGRSRDRGRRRELSKERQLEPGPPPSAPPPSVPPPPPAPPAATKPSPPLQPPIELQDGTAKRFEDMMKRVKAFALEKEKTYEERNLGAERVAECRAQEEADKKKREEEEEEEARREAEMKRKEEEEERRRQEEKRKEDEARPSSPSKPKSSQGAQSNMAQMQMMAMMMGNMGQMMGMGGMGMPGMGMGMPPAHGGQGAQAAVPKGGAHLQGFVAVKSGHPPPPALPPPGPPGDTSRDSIGAVTKSKSAGAPPPLPAPGVPPQGPGPDMNFAAKAPSPPPPPPPSGGGFDQAPRPEGEERKEEPRRRGFSDAPPSDRGPNGGDRHDSRYDRHDRHERHDRSRDRSRGRSRDRDRPVYDGGRRGRDGGGGGGLADWQEKDIEVQMVTYKRGPLLLEAIEQVGYQDYQGSLEVVIIDDSPESMAEEVEAAIAESPREDALKLRYIYLEERMSIGAKRNLATHSTSAEVICIWDDDDVFTMDRIRKQELSVRPIGLEPIAFENTLCFTRDWWESGNFGFGESWEVSGQGEGTLEPWWSQEPFLYIYLPSSASGGTALNKNRSPPPSAALAALSKALHPSSARFPEKHRGAHVSKALAAARSEVDALLRAPSLDDAMAVPMGEAAKEETLVRRSRPSAGRVQQLLAQYPESWEVATEPCPQ
eukprot:s28_g10.t1